MKDIFKIVVCIFLFLYASDLIGGDRYAYLQIQKKTLVKQKDTTSFLSSIKLPIAFSTQNFIIGQEDLALLSEVTITRIELYYTKYRESQAFNEDSLNYKRLDNLKKQIPSVFSDNRIEWAWVKQTGASSAESARRLFHGFIIHYRESGNYRDIRLFLNTLNKKDPLYRIDESEELTVTYDSSFAGADFPMIDTTVIAVLNRHTDWKNLVIVADYTGSMSPYYSQLLQWNDLNQKLNRNRVLGYVLFNDGNNMPDNEKKIGKTGGIYVLKGSSLKELASLSLQVILSGSGGDWWENDLEAVWEGVKVFGTQNEIIWLADNFSFPRDYVLSSALKGLNIKIVLCGAEAGMNPNYLKFAFENNWPIYTMEEDIENLEQLVSPEGMRYKGKKYKLNNGHVKVRN